MPVRMLRPSLKDSRKWNACGWVTQSAYARLLNVVDDHGRYYADPEILRGHLFARRPDVDCNAMLGALTEMAEVGLVLVYDVGGELYLQVTNWQERVRSKPKFPDPKTGKPADICCQLTAIAGNCPPPTPSPSPSPSTMSDSESDHVNSRNGKPEAKGYHRDTRTVLHWLNEAAGRRFREVDPNLRLISARLKEGGVDLEGVKAMIDRKSKEWIGTDMEKYLRPETLFNATKFDDYYSSREKPLAPTSRREDEIWGRREPT